MKKLVFSLLGLMITFAFAKEGPFIGVEGGGIYSMKQNINSYLCYETKNGCQRVLDYTGKFAGIKFGYDFEEYRIYGQINHNFEREIQAWEKRIDTSTGYTYTYKTLEPFISASSNEILLAYDGYFNPYDPSKMFYGLYFGIENQKEITQVKGYKDSLTQTYNGFVVGMKVGGLISINEHNGIELGIKFNYSLYSDFYVTSLGAFAGYTYKF